MTATPEGKQWISRITLDPQIEWLGDNIPSSDDLRGLHHEAHEECFLANSVRCEIRCEPVLE